MDDDALSTQEPAAVRQTVTDMVDDGFAQLVVVFVSPDGTTRLGHRDGLDTQDLLQLVLAAEGAREVQH